MPPNQITKQSVVTNLCLYKHCCLSRFREKKASPKLEQLEESLEPSCISGRMSLHLCSHSCGSFPWSSSRTTGRCRPPRRREKNWGHPGAGISELFFFLFNDSSGTASWVCFYITVARETLLKGK